MKFCKDCKFFKKNLSYLTEDARAVYSICAHEKAAKRSKPNVVTGEVTINRLLCNVMRGESSFCGPEGKLFEPKEITHSKLKSWFGLK